MNRFENKVAVITGAAGGIGEATTRRIVSEGGKVVIADYSKERADKLAAELTLSGADVRSVYFSADCFCYKRIRADRYSVKQCRWNRPETRYKHRKAGHRLF